MNPRPRIAFGGIHIECSTYNLVRTLLNDFAVLRGQALLASPLFAFIGQHNAQFLPLLHARATDVRGCPRKPGPADLLHE